MDNLRGKLCFKGERGFSAYEIAVQEGFKGDKETWLELIGAEEVIKYLPTANVKQFGIVGDGETDETDKLEAALAQGGVLIIPEDCHIVVNKALSVKSSIIGLKGSSIKQTTKRSNIFNLESDDITIEGLTLIGTGEGFAGESTEGSGTLIKSSGKNIKIINCTFKDANYVGCFIDPESTSNLIENCKFINCWAEGISVQSDYSKVINCYFENCSYNGCVVRGASHVVVDGCQFINCAITDVGLDLLPNYDKTKFCSDCVLTNNYFKNNFICISLFGGDADNTHNNITIDKNTFNGRTDSELGVRIYYTKDVKVTNNTFKAAGTNTSLLFSGCTNVICNDNTLMDGEIGIDCSCNEMGTISGNNVKNFTNIGIRTRTYTRAYEHNFNVSNNNILNCKTGIHTEGNYNKSILIDGNSITGSTTDLSVIDASDILVVTNNVFNVDNKISVTGEVNTYIRANNSNDKPTCSSSTRPNNAITGTCVFDTSYNKPIWYTGSKWIDATGADI